MVRGLSFDAVLGKADVLVFVGFAVISIVVKDFVRVDFVIEGAAAVVAVGSTYTVLVKMKV